MRDRYDWSGFSIDTPEAADEVIETITKATSEVWPPETRAWRPL